MSDTRDDQRQSLLSNSTRNGYGTDASQSQDVQNNQDTNGTEGAEEELQQHSTPKLILMLSGVYIGALLASLDSTLIGTLSAPISASFENMQALSWLASSFFIATCLSQPIVGKIADIYGRKWLFIAASATFLLGNLICTVARSENALIAGRVVAGLGGGSHGPLTTVVLSDLIPLRRRGIWQGTANICYGLGSGIGGPLGGWIAELFGWRWAFALQIPISLITILLIATKLPETVEKRDVESHLQKLRRVDWLGSATLIIFLVILLLGLNTGGNRLPWSHPLVLATFPISMIFLGLFLFIEANVAAEPVLPVHLFKNRTIVAACLTNWFVSMCRFGLLFYAPLVFQVQGYSIAQTGLRFLPESVATAAASIGAGVVMRATGRYRLLGLAVVLAQAAGTGLLGGGVGGALRLHAPAWPPFAYLFLAGLGYSGALTTTIVAMVASAERRWQALATSASFLFRSTGSVVGIALASAVFQNALPAMLRRRLLPAAERADGRARDEVERIIDRVLKDMRVLDDLPGAMQRDAREAYLDALGVVFFVLTGLSLLGFVSVSFMKEHKLHTRLSRRD